MKRNLMVSPKNVIPKKYVVLFGYITNHVHILCWIKCIVTLVKVKQNKWSCARLTVVTGKRYFSKVATFLTGSLHKVYYSNQCGLLSYILP